MSENASAKGHSPHKVDIIQGTGVSNYTLYEFGSKTNASLLPFFNNDYNKPGKPNAPKELLAFCDYIILAENNMLAFNKKNINFRKVIIEKVQKESTNSHKPQHINKNDYIIKKTVSRFNLREVI